MNNPHLILPEQEEQFETLPPKWCVATIALMFVVFIVLGFLVVNCWATKVDTLQTKLYSAEHKLEELQRENRSLVRNNETLSKENASLKCEAYFFGE